MLPSENFDCYPKICTHKIVNIFLGLRQENVFFEQKIKGNWINNYVSLVQILNSFAHFWRKKIILKILILIFIFGYCSLIYIQKVSGNLKQKNMNFESPCDFLKMKTLLRVRWSLGWNCRFFGIELLKINLIDRNVYVFKNREKC